MQCAACGGSYFEKECRTFNKTLINRRRHHDVSKCSVRPYDPNFICILLSQKIIYIHNFASTYKASIHLSPHIISIWIRNETFESWKQSENFLNEPRTT